MKIEQLCKFLIFHCLIPYALGGNKVNMFHLQIVVDPDIKWFKLEQTLTLSDRQVSIGVYLPNNIMCCLVRTHKQPF